MRAWKELWRLLADGPHRLASREGDDGWRWPWQRAAAPCPASSCTPIGAAEYTAGTFRQAC